MKTQNLIAVALTIALITAAAALGLWRSQSTSPAMTDPGAMTLETRPVIEAVPAKPVDESRQEHLATPQVAKADPPIPRGILNTCKNGFTIERDRSGTFQGWQCNPSAYEAYSTEALESLAYGDAEAAKVLAYRLRHTDYPRALRLAQRASALEGGDTSVLMSAANWRPLLDANGNPDLSGYGQAYVIHQLIERLRDSTYRAPPTYEIRIREIAEDPDAVFKQLNSIVDRMYEEMLFIELEITGNSTIGGQDDA